jgi:LTXXQ motif family protein
MFKGAIGLLSLAFVAGSSLAYAQQASGPSQADLNALTDARIGIVKAALQLTPDQAKYWPAVEDAIRARAQTRYARITAVTERLSQQRQVDPIELLRGRADALTQRAVGLKKLVDAWEPLYRSLMPDQKQRVRFLVERVMPGVMRAAMQEGRARGFDEGAAVSTAGPATGGTVGIAPR